MHEHEHDHVHDHAGQTHSHPHTHAHPHAEGAAMSAEETLALLTYMLDHNRHHAEELHELCHKLEASGKGEAAKLIDEAVDRFGEGNELLAKALEALKA